MARKILYSPGYGAGWTTWCHDGQEHKRFMLEFQPLIDAVETRPAPTVSREALQARWDEIVSKAWGPDSWAEEMKSRARFPTLQRHTGDVPDHLVDAVMAFMDAWAERFPGADLPYLGGLRDLAVKSVPDNRRVRIDEYDGSESVVIEGDGAEEWL